MSDLTRAIKEYVIAEIFINESDAILEQLQKQYDEILSHHSNQQSMAIHEAEEVFDAYEKINKHSASLSEMKETFNENEAIIKKHLEPLKGIGVSYLVPIPDVIQYPRYNFRLENGEVTHNFKKKPAL